MLAPLQKSVARAETEELASDERKIDPYVHMRNTELVKARKASELRPQEAGRANKTTTTI